MVYMFIFDLEYVISYNISEAYDAKRHDKIIIIYLSNLKCIHVYIFMSLWGLKMPYVLYEKKS